MIFQSGSSSQTTTSFKAVLPFYGYAAISFVVLCVMLFFSAGSFGGHYFQPDILAVTHIATLGWGTMIILGAGHQIIPVLIESKLYSNILAYLTFIFVGSGIPLLVYAFAVFDVGIPMQSGAIMINAGLFFFLLNVFISISKSEKENVHAIFIFTATLWLWLTTMLGLFLVYNFSMPVFSSDSLHYLPFHAHMGIAGWFLLLIIGVSSRLIPLFLISKYDNPKMLWWIFGLINTGLVLFLADLFYYGFNHRVILYAGLILTGIILFAKYCYNAYRLRIRVRVDKQISASLLSVMMIFIPALTIISLIIYFFLIGYWSPGFTLLYGFAIFMGWITAIILGMTFKTLPFIVWNKVYHKLAGTAGTPVPKELFSEKLFNIMMIVYIAAFVLCCAGIAFSAGLVMKTGAFLFIVCSVLYGLNVCKIFLHQPKIKT